MCTLTFLDSGGRSVEVDIQHETLIELFGEVRALDAFLGSLTVRTPQEQVEGILPELIRVQGILEERDFSGPEHVPDAIVLQDHLRNRVDDLREKCLLCVAVEETQRRGLPWVG